HGRRFAGCAVYFSPTAPVPWRLSVGTPGRMIGFWQLRKRVKIGTFGAPPISGKNGLPRSRRRASLMHARGAPNFSRLLPAGLTFLLSRCHTSRLRTKSRKGIPPRPEDKSGSAGPAVFAPRRQDTRCVLHSPCGPRLRGAIVRAAKEEQNAVPAFVAAP